MISITFRNLLDAVGYSGTAAASDASLTSQQAQVLLSNKVIYDAITRQLHKDWAINQMARLFVNVNDINIINAVRSSFNSYISNKSTNNAHPTTAGRPAAKIDPLVTLLSSINSDPYIKTTTKSTPSTSGASFMFNAGQYEIALTSEDTASLDEVTLQALSTTGVSTGHNMIVPKSAVFMTDKKYGSRYAANPYPVFTGVDMRLVMMTPNVITQNITLKTMTYSMHAGIIPVSALGRDRPKGWAKGDRVIAGTMIATITVNDPLLDMQPILYSSENQYARSTSDIWRTYLLPDQMPMFDVLVLFSNEYGFNAALPIYGIQITDTGSVMSMADSELEITYTYTALDIDVIRSIAGTDTEDGRVTTFDPLANNEYLAKRERAYAGISEHKSAAEVPSLYARIDTRAREIEYNNMRNKGLNISELINVRNILVGK